MPTPAGWAAGLSSDKQAEWLVDCYRMRLDDDYAWGGGKGWMVLSNHQQVWWLSVWREPPSTHPHPHPLGIVGGWSGGWVVLVVGVFQAWDGSWLHHKDSGYT